MAPLTFSIAVFQR